MFIPIINNKHPPFYCRLPSGNHPWSWKIKHLQTIFPFKSPFIFPFIYYIYTYVVLNSIRLMPGRSVKQQWADVKQKNVVTYYIYILNLPIQFTFKIFPLGFSIAMFDHGLNHRGSAEREWPRSEVWRWVPHFGAGQVVWPLISCSTRIEPWFDIYI
jgi:hypothetical protein